MNKNILPLRTGVGAIVLNKENKVFVGKRKDNPEKHWQMPQGGVDIGENFIDAMKRELLEETSIKSIEVLRDKDDKLFKTPRSLSRQSSHKTPRSLSRQSSINEELFKLLSPLFMLGLLLVY